MVPAVSEVAFHGLSDALRAVFAVIHRRETMPATGFRKALKAARHTVLRAGGSRENIGLRDRRKTKPGPQLRPEEKEPQAVRSYGVARQGDSWRSTPHRTRTCNLRFRSRNTRSPKAKRS